MDGVFSLPESTRADFLRSLLHSFGCSYICLWHPYQYSPLSNQLIFLDGFYNNIVSSCLESINNSAAAAQSLFDLYKNLTFDVNNECVPGIAFRKHMPYLELQKSDLIKLATPGIQTQFYQEARIETAIFMGCNKGEIELGFSTIHQIDIQAALGTLFPQDFSRTMISQQQLPAMDQNNNNNNNNPAPDSSSAAASSWRTVSTGSRSPECSSLLFFSTLPNPNHFPTPESEHDAIVKAFLHVISSPSPPPPFVANPEASAFNMYWPQHQDHQDQGIKRSGSQSLMKRSIAFSRRLHLMRSRERFQFQFQGARPSPTSQLHHMITERTRRHKLNQMFQSLRALLPPPTKNVKASILTAAKETLKSLIGEIEKLKKRNQHLTTLLSSSSSSKVQETNYDNATSSSSNERLSVLVSDVAGPSSSWEERMVDLQVIVRAESSSSSLHQADIVIRLLEFLKRDQNTTFISMAANSRIIDGFLINQLNFRLSIVEGSEWDESAFEEAVRRVVADLIH